jgi:hypothetical protein
VRVALALALLVALAAGSARASHLDPRKEINAVDQARARAMLVRKSDLGGTWEAAQTGNVGHLTCKGWDQSSLTVTGEAGPRAWASLPGAFVVAQARFYKSIADANSSWRRATSAAGRKCVATEWTRLGSSSGSRLLSMKVRPFPKVAPRTIAYHLVFLVGTQGPRASADVIALQNSRAQVVLTVATFSGTPLDEIALARRVAARMAKAMHGG